MGIGSERGDVKVIKSDYTFVYVYSDLNTKTPQIVMTWGVSRVGSSGLEPLTSALSKQRSEPTELTSFVPEKASDGGVLKNGVANAFQEVQIYETSAFSKWA